jgi:hypothetical protein
MWKAYLDPVSFHRFVLRCYLNDLGAPVTVFVNVDGGPAPTSVQLPDGSCVVRRIIDSDNSCLFNAVGYVMEHSRSLAQQLRRVIADRVSADPGKARGGQGGAHLDLLLSISLSLLSQTQACKLIAIGEEGVSADPCGEGEGKEGWNGKGGY